MNKGEIVYNYLDNEIFNPAEAYARNNKNTRILRGINLTRMRLKDKSAEHILQYFWNSIVSTEYSISFSNILKEAGITRFEDILEDVRIKFNDEFLKS